MRLIGNVLLAAAIAIVLTELAAAIWPHGWSR